MVLIGKKRVISVTHCGQTDSVEALFYFIFGQNIAFTAKSYGCEIIIFVALFHYTEYPV